MPRLVALLGDLVAALDLVGIDRAAMKFDLRSGRRNFGQFSLLG